MYIIYNNLKAYIQTVILLHKHTCGLKLPMGIELTTLLLLLMLFNTVETETVKWVKNRRFQSLTWRLLSW